MSIHLFILSIFLVVQDLPGFLVPSWFDPEIHTDKINILESDGITLYVENLAIDDHFMIFDVEIVNRTGSSLPVSREQVQIYESDVPFPDAADHRFEDDLIGDFPLTEEAVAEELMEEVRKNRKTGNILGLVTAGLVIFDIAMDVKDFKSPEWTPKKQLNADIRDLLTLAGLTATDAVRQQNAFKSRDEQEDLHYLSREIYNFGEIPTNDYVRGKMFFPVSESHYLRLIIRLNHIEYVMDFRRADERDGEALTK